MMVLMMKGTNLLNMMNPSNNQNLIDVACGTGDIAKLFLNNKRINSSITCVDPNKGMIGQGRQKLSKYKNIEWIISPAEKLPLPNNSFDFYTISFGLRNTNNLKKSLAEAFRVLRPGGRFFCLEFSKIQNSNFNFIYKKYSELLPLIGKFIVGENLVLHIDLEA